MTRPAAWAGRARPGAWLSAVLAIAGCGDAEREPAAAQRSSKPVEIDTATINALVPIALRSKLAFDKRAYAIDRGPRRTTYTLAAPRGWLQSSEMSVNLRPEPRAGYIARLSVSAVCDGACTAKPWEAIADRLQFAPRARGTVLKDVKQPGRRTMIAVVDRPGVATTDVVTAWWSDGDRNYHTCTASLDPAIKDAAPAFEAACLAVAIAGDD
jgi:hypothetical protein